MKTAHKLPSTVLALLLFSLLAAQPSKCPGMCICDNLKLTVACIAKNLTQIPPVNEITVELNLKGNKIQQLPTGAFKHTPYLTHLNLQQCSLQQVREGAFRGLGRLVFLNLANNKIDILYQESFDGLSSLKQLLIDHNRVEEIHPGAFSQLSFLNLLSLTYNQLVYLPNMAFQGLQNIKWLRLSHNSLNNLADEAFAGLFTLNRLSLDHNELQFFPTLTMTRLPEVTRLDLGYNPITYLGEESVVMPKLVQLYLDHMSLQDISSSALVLLPKLSQLDLSHNQLRIMQPLSGPEKLLRLNLTGNPVLCNCYLRPLREWALRHQVRLLGACTGPSHLSGESLEAVQPLDLRCQSQEAMLKAELEEMNRVTPAPTPTPAHRVPCPIGCVCESHHSTCEKRGHTKIPRGFSPETRLLDMRDNHFHYIPSHSFPGLTQLVSLHLQRCKIQELEGSAFRGMKSLLYLYLSENALTSLSPEVLKGLTKLTYLHLEGNKFSQFPTALFKLQTNLLALHLENNSIARVEQGFLNGATRLRDLYLTDNVIDIVATKAFESAPALSILHLGSNKLKEVPTEALGKIPQLAELRLSGNQIRWVGPKAFQPLAGSLEHLYLDAMGLEKMSKDCLVGLGQGLRSLLLQGNQLEEVPNLNNLISLEVINLAKNPLMCDCTLLPLRKWLEKVNLKVQATCGHPLELQGQKVKDVNVFKSCPGEGPLPTLSPNVPKTQKNTKPKSSHLKRAKSMSAKPKSAHLKLRKTKATKAKFPKKNDKSRSKKVQTI